MERGQTSIGSGPIWMLNGPSSFQRQGFGLLDADPVRFFRGQRRAEEVIVGPHKPRTQQRFRIVHSEVAADAIGHLHREGTSRRLRRTKRVGLDHLTGSAMQGNRQVVGAGALIGSGCFSNSILDPQSRAGAHFPVAFGELPSGEKLGVCEQ